MPEPAVKLWRFDLFKSQAYPPRKFFFSFSFFFKAKLFIMSLFHSDKEHLVREIKMMCTHLMYPVQGHFSPRATSTGGSEYSNWRTPPAQKAPNQNCLFPPSEAKRPLWFFFSFCYMWRS